MKTLLVINDNSPGANHAAEFTLHIAQKIGANVILANNYIREHHFLEMALAGGIDDNLAEVNMEPDLHHRLIILNEESATGFKPKIGEIDISKMNEVQLAGMINLEHIWMIVKGMSNAEPADHTEHHLNVHVVLNKVLCPLLLVPSGWPLKNIERLTYIADLRYCRLQVVRHLAEIAGPCCADLSIAHISARGLPDIAEKYALEIFKDEICRNVSYNQLFFNNIREKDLAKAVDVMINAMHNDILVLVNHRFHFEEIVGRYITDSLPLHITIPLLVFPY